MEHNIVPCGINCDLCYAFQRGNCFGCGKKSEEVRKSRLGCTILKCDKYTPFSYECGKPCKRLEILDSRYRSKYGMSILDNLTYIKEKCV